MQQTVLSILADTMPGASDAERERAASRAERAIRAYCHIPDDEPLPPGLLYVWADMAVSGARMAAEASSGAVQSITEGDTSVTYARSDGRMDVTADFAAALQPFRRLYQARRASV